MTVFRRSDCERLVGLRRLTEPLLMRSRSQSRPIAIVDDVAVPPDRLAGVVRQFQDLLKRHGVMWTLNAYAGDGRIRLRPFLDLSDPGDRAKLEPLAREVYDLVIEAGGTISASQGCGLARTQFLPRQYGELVQVFREIKDAFDPSNLLQPRQGHRRRSPPDGPGPEALPGLSAGAMAEPEPGSVTAASLRGRAPGSAAIPAGADSPAEPEAAPRSLADRGGRSHGPTPVAR